MADVQQGVQGGTSSGGAALVTIVGNPIVGSGSQTVTTAGTRVQLSAISVPCKKVTVQSMFSNTGNMYLGDSTVSSSNGLVLYPGSATSFLVTPNNLNLLYIDSVVNGEGVVYFYEN